jgi:hypothetical protein
MMLHIFTAVKNQKIICAFDRGFWNVKISILILCCRVFHYEFVF